MIIEPLGQLYYALIQLLEKLNLLRCKTKFEYNNVKFRPMNMDSIRRDYIVEKVIGEGGFGIVYSGLRKATKERVAIKVCESAMFDGDTPLEVAMLIKAASVKGVVGLIEWRKTSGKDYAIVLSTPTRCMDMFDYIGEKGGALSEPETKKMFGDIMKIISSLFDIGIVHRDIKVENILVDLSTNEVILIDFGEAALVKSEAYTDFHGTLVYAPPEWVRDKAYHAEPQTVWSCGILLYAMITGDVPFLTKKAIIRAKVVFPDLSYEAKHLIEEMLQKEPTQRPSIKQVMTHDFLL
jgi:serine/threonine protein kinase